MLSSGIDLIEIGRIQQAMDRHGERFFKRFFTPQEIEFCAGRAGRLAGRFAIKEAVAKTLGTGIGDLNWTDIEVVNDERGRPELLLHNRALEIAGRQGFLEWSISISHTDMYAIGQAIAIGQTRRDHQV